jgi:iron complex transport system substrate-binding protein
LKLKVARKRLFLRYSILLSILILSAHHRLPAAKVDNVSDGKSVVLFVDDCGYSVSMEKPARRIISLYSAHTENLYSLGLHDEIIGVGRADDYPPEVKKKKIFDYRSDPEKVIAADPDLVLIRPFIMKSSPNFVLALQNAGINVVCLYPERFEEFDAYVQRLAQLTGREVYAEELLEAFHLSIDNTRKKTEPLDGKVRVFFESTGNNYRTISHDSMAATAIQFAGGLNIAGDAVPLHKTTSIASYGTERLLQKANEIDVYVAQKGKMNPGISPDAIKKRPGFHVIKAIREEKVYCIDEKIVSSPTFRFAQGVEELARMFYPEVFKE